MPPKSCGPFRSDPTRRAAERSMIGKRATDAGSHRTRDESTSSRSAREPRPLSVATAERRPVLPGPPLRPRTCACPARPSRRRGRGPTQRRPRGPSTRRLRSCTVQPVRSSGKGTARRAAETSWSRASAASDRTTRRVARATAGARGSASADAAVPATKARRSGTRRRSAVRPRSHVSIPPPLRTRDRHPLVSAQRAPDLSSVSRAVGTARSYDTRRRDR
jgi:hypothetical protein